MDLWKMNNARGVNRKRLFVNKMIDRVHKNKNSNGVQPKTTISNSNQVLSNSFTPLRFRPPVNYREVENIYPTGTRKEGIGKSPNKKYTVPNNHRRVNRRRNRTGAGRRQTMAGRVRDVIRTTEKSIEAKQKTNGYEKASKNNNQF